MERTWVCTLGHTVHLAFPSRLSMTDWTADRDAIDNSFSPTLETPQSLASFSSYPDCKKRRAGGLSPSRSETRKARNDLAILSDRAVSGTGSPSLFTDSSVPKSFLHHVSINMVCTAEELSHLMGGLAGVGTCINIRVDAQSN